MAYSGNRGIAIPGEMVKILARLNDHIWFMFKVNLHLGFINNLSLSAIHLFGTDEMIKMNLMLHF